MWTLWVALGCAGSGEGGDTEAPRDSGGEVADSATDTADDDVDSADTGASDSGDTGTNDPTDTGASDSGEGADSGSADSAADTGGADTDGSGETGETDTGPVVSFSGSEEIERVATYETHGGVSDGRVGSIDNLALASDLSGDGVDDLVLGSPFHAPGSVFVLGAPSSWTGSVESDALATIEGRSELGFVPLAMDDVTGDGAADVIVGDRTVDGAGAAYVFEGPLAGALTDSDAWMTVTGAWPGGEWGEALDVGDIDGDGVVELIAGAAETGAGVVGVYAAAAGTFDAADGTLIEGVATGDGFGATVVIGDLDADGYPDALVGAPGRDDAATDGGAVYVLPGGASGLGSAAWTFIGPSVSAAKAGTNSRGVAPPADLDGSGAPDVAIAAYAAGQVAVFLDPAPGVYAWSAADGVLSEPGTGAGGSLAVADLDADGDDDLLVGCYNDGTYASFGGSAMLFADVPRGTFTRSDATSELYTRSRDHYLGTAVAGRDGVWFAVASWRSERASRGGTLYGVEAW